MKPESTGYRLHMSHWRRTNYRVVYQIFCVIRSLLAVFPRSLR